MWTNHVRVRRCLICGAYDVFTEGRNRFRSYDVQYKRYKHIMKKDGLNRVILFCSQRPPLEPVRLPAPVGGPRQAPPAGVQPESAAAAAQEAPGEPRLQIAGFVRDHISCCPETNRHWRADISPKRLKIFRHFVLC